MKLYRCGFKLTALIVAWFWRRLGYKTNRSTMRDPRYTNRIHFVTGIKEGEK